MTTYQFIQQLDTNIFDQLIDKGIFRATVKRDIQIYEYYMHELPKHGSMQAITNASDEFHVSERQINRIIQKYKENEEVRVKS